VVTDLRWRREKSRGAEQKQEELGGPHLVKKDDQRVKRRDAAPPFILAEAINRSSYESN